MTTNSSCCGSDSPSPCTTSIAELPRYYPRQLITPADLTLEQDYFRDRMRRHNRLLHGWGVVCGALVCPVAVTNSDQTVSYCPWVVKVQPGYILAPYGDEIILDCARTVDVRTQGVSGVTGQPCVDTPDPWCTQVFTPPADTSPSVYYIAVKYQQSMTRPVRVQPVGCGCDDSSCEYSRWHDGYQIGVLKTCPQCNACDPAVTVPQPVFENLVHGGVPACPDCTCGPWVCLAVVTVNADGTIAQIDNCSCRRMVISYANFWWKCTGTLSLTGVEGPATNPTPPVPVPINGNSVTLIVHGTNLESDPRATYSFGPGVTVAVNTPAGTALTSVSLTLTASVNAALGLHNLVVQNADCSTAMLANVIQIVTTWSAGQPSPAPTGGATRPAASGAARTRRKGSPPGGD